MIHARLQETWYGDRKPGALLGAMEQVYRRSFEARRERELARRDHSLESRPIIVVGNITVGGAGKTPLVIRLCELLHQAGLKPGVVSRGYGRKSSEQLVVSADSSVDEAGDEPVLIARRCQAVVVVDADREAAAHTAFEQGVDIVIADDGLQRWRLPRDLEICVLDAERGFGNGRLLPAGPLREPLDRLESVDYLVSNGGAPREETGVEAIEMRLEADGFHALDGSTGLDAAGMAGHVGGKEVHAVAGIGNPARFFDSLASMGLKPDHLHALPDHHAFVAGDFKDIRGVVLMTEKDAVKCSVLGLEDAWFLRVSARLPETWEQTIVELASKLVRDKRA